MPFIGNTPDVNFTSFAKQTITGNGGTSYTLSHAVANENEVEIFVNNVRQEGGSGKAYTVNGTALTMTGAVANTDSFYVIFLGKALQTTVPPDGSVSTAKIADDAVNLTSKVTGVLPVANGGTGATSIETNSVIETWYYDDTDTNHANNDILNQGYTRLTTNATATKNAGMAHATVAGTTGTGIWTFPSTGIWRIELHAHFFFNQGASLSNGIIIQVTTDNSTYVDVHGVYANSYAQNGFSNIVLPYVLNVSNITNVKFKHKVISANQITLKGGGEVHDTKINFIKLCPSV